MHLLWAVCSKGGLAQSRFPVSPILPQLPLFALYLGYRVQDKARSERESAQEHERRCKNGGGESRHESSGKVLSNDGDAQGEADGGKDERDK